ncbi:RHS repeat-associated core domain-containing protein [Streptomyces sp. ID05-47C]|uniref:RHS repeat domain-containing protein n=1 Tax=Streptomyces sp. ID05-47C TaxID=3028665 RepID=UPI0029A0F638|nr:RHS repeat-associated core domain-containing protein [Streptomyces sp. ID05-47C]MDX3569368.1 RHS repeat-associated core domain-containing protein [Streptomyces sp. ID05-47C]
MSVVVTGGGLTSVAQADERQGLKPLWERKVSRTEAVTGLGARKERERVAAVRQQNKRHTERAKAEQKVTWPSGGEGRLDVVARGNDAATPVGGLPVTVAAAGPAKGAKNRASGAAQVRVMGHQAAADLGLKGVLLSVEGTGAGSGEGVAEIGVDYGAFASAYGGGWSGRLGLVSVPECALTSPRKAECRTTAKLPSSNDIAGQSVTGTVTLSAKAPTVLALVATASESAAGTGDNSATSLSASGTWEAGASSGAFSWEYPMESPPVPGPTPSLSFSYNSGAVDGKTASTNNQSTAVGEGFELVGNSYVERTYGSCDDDGQADKNDLCWKFENANLVLNGTSSEIVKDDTSGRWRLKNDDASTIALSTGADNGDDDGEYWTVTTGDGLRYVFGRNKLEGAGTERTNSVWTAPVFGDDSGEPGYSQGTSFADRSVKQAWRWQLDYVEDLHGNAMSYWYTAETNAYAKNEASTATAEYISGGYLTKILYGQRASALFTGLAGGKVEFSYANRCTNTGCAELTESTAANWPDVPFDAVCTMGKDCDAKGPAFFSRKRLTKIDTYVWAADTSAFKAVDSWALGQQYLDGGDIGDTTDQTLVLQTITRTGKNGTAITMDPVSFTYDMRPNRVDATDDILPLTKPRIRTITTETGSIVDVTLSGQECVRGSNMPRAPDDNTKACFPQFWNVNGAENASIDWFHKYRVLAVVTTDPAGLNPNIESKYSYSAPAWHYNDSPFTPTDERTWSVWRGYRTVTATQGSGTDLSKVTSVYLQGMDGDRLLNADGALDPDARRGVTVPGMDLAGLDVPDQKDSDQFEGHLRQEITYNGDTPISVTVNDPWSQRTATQHKSYADTEAHFIRIGKVTSHTHLTVTGTWRSTADTTTFDTYGMPVKVSSTGDTAKAGDERCTRTWYARNDTQGINLLPTRQRITGKACSVAETSLSLPGDSTSRGDVMSDTAVVYDNSTATAWSAAQTPTKADVTWIGRASGYPAAATDAERHPTSWQTVNRGTYDILGRALTAQDADGNPTTLAYTPAGTGPTTRIQKTDPKSNKSYEYLDPARGATTKTYDINTQLTETAYDALGRSSAVWLPNRSRSNQQSASFVFGYSVTKNAPPWTSTGTLKADGNTYTTSYTIYDSLLRQIQTQTPGATSGRVMTETRYDSRGLAYEKYTDVFDTAGPSGTFTRTENGEATATATDYDAAGRPVSSTFLVGGEQKWRTTTSYTGDSTATSGVPGGSATRAITDGLGRTVEQREYAGTSAADNEFGGGPGAVYSSTRFTHTLDDKQKTVTGPDGAAWSYVYDLHGRQTSSSDPDTGTTTTGYTALDQTAWTKDATGRAVISEYDVLGRLTATWKSGVGADLANPSTLAAQKTDANKLTARTYDSVTGAKGQLASSTRYVGGAAGKPYTRQITAYDKFYNATASRLTLPSDDALVTLGAVPSNVLDFSSAYNVDGSLQFTKEPAAGGLAAETVERGYTARGLPQTLTGGGLGIVLNTTYTDFSQVSTLTLGVSSATGVDKVDIARGYEDGTHRLLRTQVRGQSHAWDALNQHYVYDTAGNVTKISDTTTMGGTGAADHQCFAYDGHRRLTEAWTPADGDCAVANRTAATLGGAAAYWTGYTYNDAGQRATETKHAIDGTESRTTHCYRGGTSQPHSLLATTATSCTGVAAAYGYDATGATTTRPDGANTQKLVWNDEGELSQLVETASADGSTHTTDYVHDADGELLIRRDTNGETILYLGATEVHLKGSGSTSEHWGQRYYAHGDASVALRSNESGAEKLTWLAGDTHGTSTLAIDAETQAVVKRYTTPFGADRGQSLPGAWPDDKGFLGKSADASTGLTHIGAREYDPAVGQFISVDPVLSVEQPQSLNGYSYGGNNPVTNADPSGLMYPPDYFGGPAPNKVAKAPAFKGSLSIKTVKKLIWPAQVWKKATARSIGSGAFLQSLEKLAHWFGEDDWRYQRVNVVLAQVVVDGGKKGFIGRTILICNSGASKKTVEALQDLLEPLNTIVYQVKGKRSDGKPAHSEQGVRNLAEDVGMQKETLGGKIVEWQSVYSSNNVCDKNGNQCGIDLAKATGRSQEQITGTHGFVDGFVIDDDFKNQWKHLPNSGMPQPNRPIAVAVRGMYFINALRNVSEGGGGRGSINWGTLDDVINPPDWAKKP